MKKILVVIIVLVLSNCLFARDYEVGDHDLFLMPTAYTMPKGTSCFSDYELFFINYSFAPTDRTQIGAFSLFPITTEFLKTFTIGIKQNYFQQKNTESAAWLVFNPETQGISIGNVISVDFKKTSVHLGLSGLNAEGSDSWEYLFMLGGKAPISKNADFIVEFENTNSAMENNFEGVLSLGLRFKGKRISWDFAGIRPLGVDMGYLLFFPLIKATVFFD
jgi:hypothetical protein